MSSVFDFNDDSYDDIPEKKLTRAQLRAEHAKQKRLELRARKKRRANVEKIIGGLRRQLIGGDYDVQGLRSEIGMVNVTLSGSSYTEYMPTGQLTITLNCTGPLRKKRAKPAKKKK